jgi:cytochrome b involved in lipid metabolism
MKGVLDQELKSVRQSTTETTTLKYNTPATALKPTGSQNTEDIKLLAPPGLTTEKKGKGILNSAGELAKELKDDTDSSTDLICLDSIERMNREVSRFKNELDNMWLKNNDFVYTKENS